MGEVAVGATGGLTGNSTVEVTGNPTHGLIGTLPGEVTRVITGGLTGNITGIVTGMPTVTVEIFNTTIKTGKSKPTGSSCTSIQTGT